MLALKWSRERWFDMNGFYVFNSFIRPVSCGVRWVNRCEMKLSLCVFVIWHRWMRLFKTVSEVGSVLPDRLSNWPLTAQCGCQLHVAHARSCQTYSTSYHSRLSFRSTGRESGLSVFWSYGTEQEWRTSGHNGQREATAKTVGLATPVRVKYPLHFWTLLHHPQNVPEW